MDDAGYYVDELGNPVPLTITASAMSDYVAPDTEAAYGPIPRLMIAYAASTAATSH